MQVSISDIEMAMDFVSDYSFDNEAYIDTESGEIYYVGDAVDEPLPSDLYENDKYVHVPTKRDLDLGKPLVLRFVEEKLPTQIDRVHSIFRSRGAYSRLKELLADLEALDQWYEYEKEATVLAIEEWCMENEIKCRRDS